MKICSICGVSDNETEVYGNFCRKHYLQIKRHGKTLDRTMFDKNEFSFDGDIVTMTLFNKYGVITGYTKFDASEYDRISLIKWYLCKGYVIGSTPGKKIFLHRFIMNTQDGFFTDHIDGDKTNNCRENLRICTKAENSRNRANRKTIAGVKKTPSGRFCAVITYNYVTIYLGTFDTFDMAASVRLEAERKYFGEYSVIDGQCA